MRPMPPMSADAKTVALILTAIVGYMLIIAAAILLTAVL